MIFPTGFFNSCALLGHSDFDCEGGGDACASGVSGASGVFGMTGGGGEDSVVIFNLRGS